MTSSPTKSATRGVIAAGHAATAEAGARMFAAGGNAFDAVSAAMCSACLAEPVLASLGGGGFLMARPAGGEPVLYDFFVQTPGQRRGGSNHDFYPILANFGDTTQEFHIGTGSIATPGAIAGLFHLQRALCSLPMETLMQPTLEQARAGIEVTEAQARIFSVVAPTLTATPEAFALFASPSDPERLIGAGERLLRPQFADALEALQLHGEDLFYRGAWAARMDRDCAARGGHLSANDLAAYHVAERPVLGTDYRAERVYLNPPPSLGGLLIALSLDLLGQVPLGRRRQGSYEHLEALVEAMELTQTLRDGLGNMENGSGFPSEARMAQARSLMRRGPLFPRGTTQISAADRDGNLASLTLSNGEGSGYVLPGTGIVLNNMLGEDDLHPEGLDAWPPNRRISSMMCPTLVEHASGGWTITGSAGSNRIRSAILQVLSNRIDFGLSLEEAVSAPRLHLESGRLSVEPGLDPDVVSRLGERWGDLHPFSEPNLFFGGAHSVHLGPDGELHGAADPRRSGVVRLI